MLFTTPDLGNYISGAILYEETLFQNHADGTPFVDCLNNIGVIPGIKVDTGLSPLPGGHEVETWCSGLDGLVERAKKYYAQGARFAKWRAVLQITSDGAPSNLSIQVSFWRYRFWVRASFFGFSSHTSVQSSLSSSNVVCALGFGGRRTVPEVGVVLVAPARPSWCFPMSWLSWLDTFDNSEVFFFCHVGVVESS